MFSAFPLIERASSWELRLICLSSGTIAGTILK